MDTTAIIKDDRTFIPVRFVAEALGLEVEWIGMIRKEVEFMKKIDFNNKYICNNIISNTVCAC